MDLRQLAAAVRAHRVAAFIGLMAAVGLAFLAQVRVDPLGDPMLSYRKPVVWSSSITLRLTHAGFPEGKVNDQGSGVAGLAPLYAALATTDPVKRRMRQAGPILGGVRVDPLGTDQNMLPFIRISSFAFQPSSATARARRQATAFIGYVAQQQRANEVAPRNRVVLEVANGPTGPTIVIPRKVTLSVVVFLSMLIVTGGVILALENLHPRAPKPEVAKRPSLEALAGQPEPVSPSMEPRQDDVAVTRQVSAGSSRSPVRTLRADAPTEGMHAVTDDDAHASRESGGLAASDAGGRAHRSPGSRAG